MRAPSAAATFWPDKNTDPPETPNQEAVYGCVEATVALGERLRDLGAVSRYTLNTPFLGTRQVLERDALGLTIYDDDPDLFDCRQPVIDTPQDSDRNLILSEQAISLGRYGSLTALFPIAASLQPQRAH